MSRSTPAPCRTRPARRVLETSHLNREAGASSTAVLVTRAKAGSLPAFADLVARFEDRLFNFLVRRTGRIADAEDLTQETFVCAWEQIDRYDPRWQFSTWLFTIARRLTVTHYRRAEVARRAMVAADPPDRGLDPGQAIADRDHCRHLP